MSNTKIELTPERADIIQAAFREHLAAGLSTEPADFDTAQAAITRMYERIGKKPPYFVRVARNAPRKVRTARRNLRISHRPRVRPVCRTGPRGR
jgi:hypothetical protein